MTSGDFLRKLKLMNRRLNICAFDNSDRLAGIYYICPIEGVVDICGIDKNNVPEYPTYDSRGHVIKSGWRRALKILLSYRDIRGRPIITRDQVTKQFGGGFFLKREPNWLENIEGGNEVQNMLEAKKKDSLDKIGKEVLSRDDLLEAHEVLDKKYMTDDDREKMDRESYLFKKDPDAYARSISAEELKRVGSQWKEVK